MGLFNISKPNRQDVKDYFQRQLESIVPKNTNIDNFEFKDAETYSRMSEKANSEKIEKQLREVDKMISKHQRFIEKGIEKAAKNGKYIVKYSVNIDDEHKKYKIDHLENMKYFKKLKDLGFVIDFSFERDLHVRWENLVIRIKW